MLAKRAAGRSERRAVIFDFDGTIADSFAYVFEFLKKEAGKSGAVYSTDQLAEFRGLSMKSLALRLGVPPWRLPFTYFKGRKVMRRHMEHVQPFRDMTGVVRRLHADGYMLYIASSNSRRNIRKLLRGQGLNEYFTAVRGNAGIASKPALIRQILLRYRLSAQLVWYVGDETGDVGSARRAGVRSLAVGWGFADPERLKQLRPDGYAQRPADIVRIIERSWKK